MTSQRPVPPSLERASVLLGPALRDAVDRLGAGLAIPARYHFGWADSKGNPLPSSRAGKGVRPTLALLSAEAVGAAPQVALPGAVAVELIHNFSLVHDDIVDDDHQRRQRPTMWKVFGVGDAVIAGDALMGLALQTLLEDATPQRTAAAADLTRATMAMITGQYLDMSFHQRQTVTVEECWEMVSNKTGALLAHAGAVGAILAGASNRVVEALRTFGNELGLAFQAQDDLLGIWGDPAVTGKPVGNDLREKKRSVPVTVALCSGTEAGAELARLYSQDRLDDQQIIRAASLVEEAGGKDATEAAAHQRLLAASQALSSADIEPAPAQEMLDLANFVVNREF